MNSAERGIIAVSANYQKLRSLLQELFQLDQADLDFGIYRIMNQKREEVVRFLDRDLLPQVKKAFEEYKPADKAILQEQLDQAIQQASSLGVDPEQANKVRELRLKIAESAVDVTALENEVFSHLTNFFRRYYSEGDFISLRRYKEGVYAIPYEGEEVKLHWANADQYYVKSTETFRDYTFIVAGGKRVRVHLVAASTEQNNNKEAQGKERRFVLSASEPLREENGELYISFEYRPADGSEKQDELNRQAIPKILKTKGFEAWAQELGRLAPTEKNKERTVLEKHLSQYTARNTFDYFIHKDLGGFLRRELDFYIKNEVMHLDDIEHESAPKVEQYLSEIKVVRGIANKIIAFLEQLENFQKKLWLKKKFVVETGCCITLDRVPEQLYTEITKSDAQREEWVRLFGIDEIKKDLTQPGYSKPLKPAFLKAHPFLPLDTRHFTRAFYQHLTASANHTDSMGERCLIRADNFHALSMLASCRAESVRFVYIDPPYNTGSDEFLYKDSYQHSSWCALLDSRLVLACQMLADDGCIAVSIGQEELGTLQYLMDRAFGIQNRICVITVQRASVTGHKVINPGVVNISEYVLLYAKNRRIWTGNTVYSERERDERYNAFVRNRTADPSQWELTSVLDSWSDAVGIQKSALRKHFGDQYTSELTKFVYENADAVCQPVTVDIGGVGADFREAVERSKKAGDKIQVFRRSGFSDVYLRSGKNLIFYRDKLIKIGERLATAERASDIWTDVLPNDLHNEGGVTLAKGKKPEALLARLIGLGTDEGDTVLDFFVGTGTTAAVAQKMNRRWLCIESGAFFDEKPLARMKNVLSGESRGVSAQFGWKGGGSFKVVQLESYEDALNNLELRRTNEQATLLDADTEAREQYTLSYMLDVESRASQSLLNLDGFRHPEKYKLRVERNGETQLVNVDLVETFNWLLGLTVKHIDVIRGVCVVQGTTPKADRVLVLWRNLDEMDSDKLDEWFEKQHYNTRDLEFDLVYVNGDNNLENLRRPDQTWKVRLIEEEFQRLMFDVQDV